MILLSPGSDSGGGMNQKEYWHVYFEKTCLPFPSSPSHSFEYQCPGGMHLYLICIPQISVYILCMHICMYLYAILFQKGWHLPYKNI